MKKLILVLLLCLLPSLGWGATYTIGPGQTYTTFTLLVATETLTSDDIVDGGSNTFREQWELDGAGTSGHPVTLRNATILGSTAVLGATEDWSEGDDGVWSKNIGATAPIGVWFNDTVIGVNDATPDTQYEWTYSNPNLTVFTAAGANNPATYYTSIEAGQREYGVYGWHKDFITVENINVKYANKSGMMNLGGDNWIVDSCNSSYNREHGIRINGQDDYPTDNTVVRDCTVTYNAYGGIDVYYNGSNITISGNTSHHNVQIVGSTSGGIKINDTTLDTCTIEKNIVYSNGPTVLTQGEGTGIWVDTTGGSNIVRYNLVYGNGDYGIYLENEPYGNEVYYNIVHSHVSDENAYAGTGIYLQRQVKGNKIYNNVSTLNRIGIGVVGDVPAAEDSCENNLIRNNISSGNTVRELSAWYGGENDGTNGSGNVYTYNALGVEASNFIEWGATSYRSTYDAWETSYGGTTNSVEADPLLVSATDYHIVAASPCKNAGTSVSLTRDKDGIPIVGLPDIGAYEYFGGHAGPGAYVIGGSVQ